MPNNGEINTRFGVYRSGCCGAKIVITVGATFPDCPNHRNLTTTWRFVPDEKIQSWEMNNAAIAPIGAHIENQRLFDMASGRLQVSSSEINHLHECRMCQGVLNVFIINQPRSEDTKAKGKSDPAA